MFTGQRVIIELITRVVFVTQHPPEWTKVAHKYIPTTGHHCTEPPFYIDSLSGREHFALPSIVAIHSDKNIINPESIS